MGTKPVTAQSSALLGKDTLTLRERAHEWIYFLKTHADSWWYGPVIAFLAFADSFILIVPTDGLLISGTLLAPRRWWTNGLFVAVGSSLGGLGLALLVHHYGGPALIDMWPHVTESVVWHWCDEFMGSYGLWVVFCVAILPIVQPPAIILAVLANLSVGSIFLVVLVARLIKYFAFAWVASHTPRLLGKLWDQK